MTSSESKQPKKSLRKRIVNSLKSSKKDDKNESQEEEAAAAVAAGGLSAAAASSPMSRNSSGSNLQGIAAVATNGESSETHTRSSRSEEDGNNSDSASSKKSKRRGEGFVRRMRSLSRSRSRANNDGPDSERPKTIVTVTSCRSDGYYNQKAPGSTSKLPRKAPTNLKLFHELAVGVKDGYAAVGQTPMKPVMETNEETGRPNMSETEFQSRNVLWEFIGNIDFVRTHGRLARGF
jgi:hypothetical protein